MFFWLLLFESTFTSIFKDKKSQRSHKTVGIAGFLTIFAWWYKDPEPYLWLTDPDPDPGGQKTNGTVRIQIRNSVCQTGLWYRTSLLDFHCHCNAGCTLGAPLWLFVFLNLKYPVVRLSGYRILDRVLFWLKKDPDTWSRIFLGQNWCSTVWSKFEI